MSIAGLNVAPCGVVIPDGVGQKNFLVLVALAAADSRSVVSLARHEFLGFGHINIATLQRHEIEHGRIRIKRGRVPVRGPYHARTDARARLRWFEFRSNWAACCVNPGGPV